ncbi:ninjurin-2 isoform X3 [Bactrocera neohumeralis]|uniref:ninjurin-2 isoform X3 n=1 Tax=Bactrocera neohumeralis TaxID=98809 RepID=UPI0021663670|nr:ninjurin-2 isoform X3 [Bactrocera neohumeralis]XP_050338019.1 ninjurin-2 isoform X3 [Bactrocera neohumeralis]
MYVYGVLLNTQLHINTISLKSSFEMAQIATSIANAFSNESEMKAMDANRYATKKTIAQGMLDIALLTANASQLKYILQVGDQHQFYKLMLIMISLSIILQVIAGSLLVVLSVIGIHKNKYQRSLAETLNHTVNGVIFVSVFCDIIKMSFGLDPAIPMVGKVDKLKQ